ncbi:hypothetical protein B0T10DRAFT_408142 [Thelonectria olida]|uniref:Uncharacterized protein n=1 Tax=Thelonectria olida TaxID=1576542 RepID=A0A9P8W1B8_9HYPO|nr:hypothetical protein B0T10DRAFT_408142 [Thelonectria olida]
MDSDSPALVFINKDSTSRNLTRSEDGERAFILSHVQRQRRSKTGNSRQNEEPWAKFTTRIPARQATVPSKASLHSRDETRGEQAVALSKSPSHNASEPFYCTIAAMDAGNHAMLHFTFDRAAKHTFLAEAFVPASRLTSVPYMRHDKIIIARLKRCVEDKALMYSTIAYGSSCLAWMGGIQENHRQPGYFVGQALEALRLHLSQSSAVPIDDWLLLSVYGLAITAFWNSVPILWSRCPERYTTMLGENNDTQGCRVHLRALLKLVTDAGGWARFDKYVLESATLVDKYLAWDLTQPILASTWNSEALVTRIPNPEHNDITTGFGTGFNNLELPPNLLYCISSIVNYTNYAQEYWAGSARSSNTESLLFLELQAITCRLLSFATLIELSECVRLATPIFILNATNYHGAQASASGLLVHLQSGLISARFWEDSFDEGMRFWCLFTTAMATQSCPSRDWFVSKARSFYASKITVDSLLDRLGQYLFIVSRQRGQVLGLWHRLFAI